MKEKKEWLDGMKDIAAHDSLPSLDVLVVLVVVLYVLSSFFLSLYKSLCLMCRLVQKIHGLFNDSIPS